MIELDVTDDHLMWDGLEAVDLLRQGAKTRGDDGKLTVTGNTVTNIPNALRRQATQRDIDLSNGALQLGDLRWELATNEATGGVPKRGDKIKDGDDVLHKILIVDTATLKSRYRCFTRC